MKPEMKPSPDVVGKEAVMGKKPVPTTLFSLMRKYALRLGRVVGRIVRRAMENRPENPSVRRNVRPLLNSELAKVLGPEGLSPGHKHVSSKPVELRPFSACLIIEHGFRSRTGRYIIPA